MKLIAGALLLGLASAASAVTLVGGGATLPVLGYTKVATGTPITAPVSGSLFAVYNAAHGTTISYCPTGSGAGKKILAGNVAGATVNDACPSGFGAAASLGLTQPHFAGSDAPMSTSEYNAYLSGHGATAQPTQLPSIAGAVGIVFKKSGVTSLTLTEDQICGIFSGRINDWSAISSASGPINIAYRTDGSGTSFSFLNHLSFVCPTVTNPETEFKTLQLYGPATTGTGAGFYFNTANTPHYVSSFGGNGNAGVIAVVAGTAAGAPSDGSIGYAEVANGVTGGVRIASVRNTAGNVVNPATGFGTAVVPVTLTFDKVIADAPDSAGRPVLNDLPGSATSGGCIAVVNPNSYADLGAAAGSTAYPIVAITNLLGNKQGNPAADLADTRGLLSSPYDTTIRSSVTSIGRIGTGYAWLSSSDLTAARVTSCIN